MKHGTAPDDGLVTGIEKSYGDYLEAVGLHGLDAIFSNHFWLAAYSQHEWDVGTVDVGIEEADSVAHLGQSDSEVYRQSGLADTAFARAHGEDDIDSRKGLWSLCGLTRMRRHVCVQGITLRRKWIRTCRTLDYTGDFEGS
jgi:hypothetical protein